MALQTAVLQGGLALGTSAAPLYAVPSGKSAWVKRAVFTNTTGAAVTLTVSVTRGTGTPLMIVSVQPIPANGTYVSPELSSLAMASGDAISASCSAAGAVNAFVSGLTA